MEETVLNYFKANPKRDIDYKEICYFLHAVDASVVLAMKTLIDKGKLFLITNDTKGWRKLFICRLR